MREISKNQLQDAHDVFSTAIKPFGGLRQAEVPRPDYTRFEQWAVQNNCISKVGCYMLKPRQGLPGCAGLMARAVIPRRGQEPAMAAGIILEDEKRIGVLGGHSRFTPLVHVLLQTVYLNNRSTVLGHPDGIVQPGYGGHAIVAASALANRGNVHDTVHRFTNQNFGTELTRQGLQDIHVGHTTVRVRAGTFALQSVGLEIAKVYQPEEVDILGAGLQGEAANVALTFVATMSNPDAGKIDLERSFSEMSK